MGAVLYGLLIAHFLNYKQYYLKIFMTFSVTYMVKRLVKVIGSVENSQLVALGGYSLTGVEFVKLLQAVKDAATKTHGTPDGKFLEGWVGDGIQKIMDIFK